MEREAYIIVSLGYENKFILPASKAGELIGLLGGAESVTRDYDTATREYNYHIKPIGVEFTLQILTPVAYDLIKGNVINNVEAINSMSGAGS